MRVASCTWRRRAVLAASLGAAALLAPLAWRASAARMAARQLGDLATIDVPAGLDAARYLGDDDEMQHRASFQFESTYLWASMSGKMHHREVVVVSVLSPDAPAHAWRRGPQRHVHALEQARVVRDGPLGAGHVTVTEGVYPVVEDRPPATQHLYAQPARRLQIFWHAVRSERDPAVVADLLPRMAASFTPHRVVPAPAAPGRRP